MKHPKTFCEKVNWLKLHDHNNSYRRFVDKAEAKKAVAEIIGKEHVVPLIGVYDRFDDIPFDTLPDQFVMKCTHDSGSCLVCKDKSSFDLAEARRHFEKYLNRNYYMRKREWVYKDIKPRILVEEYIDELGHRNSVEYKLTCFGGKVGLITVCTGIPHEEYQKRNNDFFDRDFNHLPFYVYYQNAPETPVLPAEIDQMIKLSELLAKDTVEVRVDWYLTNGKLYFGEMTFYTWSGICKFTPKSWDRKIGDMIDLSLVKNPV